MSERINWTCPGTRTAEPDEGVEHGDTLVCEGCGHVGTFGEDIFDNAGGFICLDCLGKSDVYANALRTALAPILGTCTQRLPVRGLCPICGEDVTLTGDATRNGRLIGSCGNAFTAKQWLENKAPEELEGPW